MNRLGLDLRPFGNFCNLPLTLSILIAWGPVDLVALSIPVMITRPVVDRPVMWAQPHSSDKPLSFWLSFFFFLIN